MLRRFAWVLESLRHFLSYVKNDLSNFLIDNHLLKRPNFCRDACTAGLNKGLFTSGTVPGCRAGGHGVEFVIRNCTIIRPFAERMAAASMFHE